MFDKIYLTTIAMVVFVAIACVLIQKFFKKYLESDQYYYLKDITLVAAWALCGIWTPDGPLRITIAAGVFAACVGFCQKVSKAKNLRFFYFLIGLGFSIFGPRISFIEFSGGGYYYLPYFLSIAMSTLWIGIFPIFLQEVDEIPGMCGLMLTVCWTLMSAVILVSSRNIYDVSQICIAGMIFLIVFWSRHVHPYRRLTEPLTALWGTLFAGFSVFGVSKGVAFYSLAFLPIGFLILPIAETVLSVVSAFFMPSPTGNFILYRKLIKSGKDHTSAISTVTRFCAFTGFMTVAFQFKLSSVGFIILPVLCVILSAHFYFKHKYISHVPSYERHPVLWGVKVDNISLNYALSQVHHWITYSERAKMIVTPDALAALRSRKDATYRDVIKKAALILPDGFGLTIALKILGTPIQERIPGVEFTEHLCKKAAYEGWGVWFLGGQPGVAQQAADVLSEKYPGLTVSGVCDGYFKKEDTKSLCDKISQSGAKILFVGLGVPKQEFWLKDNLLSTGACVGMGIGGSMDVLSGRLTRAPQKWQKCGMEWLYRLMQEPWRWRRIIKLPVFVFMLLLTVLHIDGYIDEDIQ